MPTAVSFLGNSEFVFPGTQQKGTPRKAHPGVGHLPYLPAWLSVYHLEEHFVLFEKFQKEQSL
jgi:hypothetical protein